jgi:hypothetical protein
MTFMVVEVYEALKRTGASEEGAMAAATAAYESKAAKVERDLVALKIMAALTIALNMAVLFRLVR